MLILFTCTYSAGVSFNVVVVKVVYGRTTVLCVVAAKAAAISDCPLTGVTQFDDMAEKEKSMESRGGSRYGSIKTGQFNIEYQTWPSKFEMYFGHTGNKTVYVFVVNPLSDAYVLLAFMSCFILVHSLIIIIIIIIIMHHMLSMKPTTNLQPDEGGSETEKRNITASSSYVSYRSGIGRKQ